MVVIACLAYALLRPLFALAHELTAMLVAGGLHAVVGSGAWEPLIGWLGLDPIYTGGAIRSIGGVHVSGLAVAGGIGAWLHALLPQAILSPEAVASSAGISMVASPGASVLGCGLASLITNVLWLALGMWLTFGRPTRRPVPMLFGWLIQAQVVVNHLLATRINLADLDASGLPLALAIATPNRETWFSQGLRQLPDSARVLVVGATLVGVAYLGATLLLLLIRSVGWLARRGRRFSAGEQRRAGRGLVWAGAAVALLTAVSPVGALALGTPNWNGVRQPALGSSLTPRSMAAARLGIAAPGAPVVSHGGPTPVQVERAPDGSWQYVVGGQPRVLRGVGYNPQYAALDETDRARIYDRDFSAMRQLGINTIEGWFETQFDQVTLDAATRNGIGVIMPFELNQDWPYENPNVQQSILDHVSAYVERYKDDPAVRMWAPGNEDLHRIIFPHWTTRESDPTVRARADAFAAFLPVLVDRIHQLDPNHPVLYRDAEDLYLARLKTAFQATGVDRPWLIYGANVYSETRLRQIVAGWPTQWLNGPLVISEFAPTGVSPAERGLGFQQDWAIIRSRPDVVLGGLAYTWATNGPEQLDRVFGLVDDQAVPTDGALSALAAAYQADIQAAQAPSGG